MAHPHRFRVVGCVDTNSTYTLYPLSIGHAFWSLTRDPLLLVKYYTVEQ